MPTSDDFIRLAQVAQVQLTTIAATVEGVAMMVASNDTNTFTTAQAAFDILSMDAQRAMVSTAPVNIALIVNETRCVDWLSFSTVNAGFSRFLGPLAEGCQVRQGDACLGCRAASM